MPFKSEEQRRYMHANLPEIAQRWEQEYSNGGIMRLPFRTGHAVEGQYRDRGRDRETYKSQTQYSNPNRTTTKSGDTYASNDPTLEEKIDFVGETRFGPTQKYTGKSPWFGGANKYGYTDQYTDPTKSNFGQLKPGYGGRLLGGLASMVTGIPFVGSTLGSLYDKGKGIFSNKPKDMSQYNKRGLFSPSINPNSYQEVEVKEDEVKEDENLLDAYMEYTESTGNPISFEEFKELLATHDMSLIPDRGLLTAPGDNINKWMMLDHIDLDRDPPKAPWPKM
jgi:hypothetical protein